jgi:hypothetical protein
MLGLGFAQWAFAILRGPMGDTAMEHARAAPRATWAPRADLGGMSNGRAAWAACSGLEGGYSTEHPASDGLRQGGFVEMWYQTRTRRVGTGQ